MSTIAFYKKRVGKALKPNCLRAGLMIHAPFIFLDNPCPLHLRIDTDSHPDLLNPPPLGPEELLPQIDARLRKNPSDAFDEKLPELKKLGLHKKEELLVFKAKMRPAIVISGHNFNQGNSTLLALPTFTLDKAYITDKEKQLIRDGSHPQYFYLPPSEEFEVKESFGDFSQVQSIAIERVRPTSKCLTDLALQALYLKQVQGHTDALHYITTKFS
ncbi:hypothetical protein CN501_08250 [Bacillus cereus]|uniref:hypothetical protein n=1 Tax=Bacillus cereus TaxID=1396 RepID=UPI000BF98286|nr:hypothetical protein [Bacillus cereus]PES17522.1 hypothetical protein CN501_08250 [Bacillus cereus]